MGFDYDSVYRDACVMEWHREKATPIYARSQQPVRLPTHPAGGYILSSALGLSTAYFVKSTARGLLRYMLLQNADLLVVVSWTLLRHAAAKAATRKDSPASYTTPTGA